MGIWVDASGRQFQLDAGGSSYRIEALAEGYLAHWYWGPRLRARPGLDRRTLLRPRAFSPNVIAGREDFSLDVVPQEYPTWGRGDYRLPAYQARQINGSAVTDLHFARYRLVKGKPHLETGLPQLMVGSDQDAETLIITLVDTVTQLEVELFYTAFTDLSAVIRSARLLNRGGDPISLERALSVSVDFPSADWQWVRLMGAWGRERHLQRTPLGAGLQAISSRRGTSSHQANPFLALVEPAATETQGSVYAMNLIYSGNFFAGAEVDQFSTTRMAMGINPFQFQWQLLPGESFTTPEAVLAFSDRGLGQMSATFHRLYRGHLGQTNWKTRERPIVLNNWEATYFAFDEAKLLELARTAADLGVEMLVLDDGWFGDRHDDRRALGDWTVNRDKLPHGLSGLAEGVHELGLGFGLWVEPEMVSVESALYRQHPDWCLAVPDRTRSEGRHQLVLDLSRDEVGDWIIDWMSEILATGLVDYIKWDMNRHMTEVGSAGLPADRQGETSHRYMLGLYRVLETLTTKFPHVLFEGCSGGGGRFDPGMLYYMPQTWASDDSDAIERLKIQYGTSLVYPAAAMTAHVSAVPNHQVGRRTPMGTRGWVAMSASFGYELDVTRLSLAEQDQVRRQIGEYKRFRPLVQFGDLYRLLDPHGENAAAWMFVGPDRAEALVIWVNRLAEAAGPAHWLLLRGLDCRRDYRVARWSDDGQWRVLNVAGGDALMGLGLSRSYRSDFEVAVWHLEARPADEGGSLQ